MLMVVLVIIIDNCYCSLVYRERKQKIEDIKRNVRDAILVSIHMMSFFSLPMLTVAMDVVCNCSFIHSFGHFYSAPSSPLLLRGAPDYSTDTVSEFHAEAHRQ